MIRLIMNNDYVFMCIKSYMLNTVGFLRETDQLVNAHPNTAQKLGPNFNLLFKSWKIRIFILRLY